MCHLVHEVYSFFHFCAWLCSNVFINFTGVRGGAQLV